MFWKYHKTDIITKHNNRFVQEQTRPVKILCFMQIENPLCVKLQQIVCSLTKFSHIQDFALYGICVILQVHNIVQKVQ